MIDELIVFINSQPSRSGDPDLSANAGENDYIPGSYTKAMEWYRYNDKDFNGEIKRPAQTTSSFYCKYLCGLWRNVSRDARLAQSSDFREFICVAHLLSCLAFKTLVCITISHIQEERSSSSYKHFHKLLTHTALFRFGNKLWKISKVSHGFTACWNHVSEWLYC